VLKQRGWDNAYLAERRTSAKFLKAEQERVDRRAEVDRPREVLRLRRRKAESAALRPPLFVSILHAHKGAAMATPLRTGKRSDRDFAGVVVGVLLLLAILAAVLSCAMRMNLSSRRRLRASAPQAMPYVVASRSRAARPRSTSSMRCAATCRSDEACPPGRSSCSVRLRGDDGSLHRPPAHGIAVALQPMNLLYALIGVTLGTAVGVLPGIGPALTVALLLPVTYKLDPAGSLIMFAGIYYGGMYGGSTTSILINTPGESASMVTALEGNKMAKAGRGGPALATAAIGSFVAGTIATLGLAFLAPWLVEFALSSSARRIISR
jgi:hypothetical protein